MGARLPGAEHAIVELSKLLNYCLSKEHPQGRHKARVFAATLGLTVEDAEELRDALLNAAITNDAIATEKDEYGQRYIVDFLMVRLGKEATIRSSWIIRRGETSPRLTSCYVL